jgi:hypothetical protein
LDQAPTLAPSPFSVPQFGQYATPPFPPKTYAGKVYGHQRAGATKSPSLPHPWGVAPSPVRYVPLAIKYNRGLGPGPALLRPRARQLDNRTPRHEERKGLFRDRTKDDADPIVALQREHGGPRVEGLQYKGPQPRRTPCRPSFFSCSYSARFSSSSSFGAASLLALGAHRAYEQPPGGKPEDEPYDEVHDSHEQPSPKL